MILNVKAGNRSTVHIRIADIMRRDPFRADFDLAQRSSLVMLKSCNLAAFLCYMRHNNTAYFSFDLGERRMSTPFHFIICNSFCFPLQA